MRRLRVKATQLFDVPSVNEDFAVNSIELKGAWSKHLYEDVWSLPWWRELVVVLVALDEVEHQVPDIEGPTAHLTAMAPAQCLLVLGRAEVKALVQFW